MGAKVTYDWANKIIQVDVAPVGGSVEIDIKEDIYSDGKQDWKDDADLNKFRFPVTPVGGDLLPGSKTLGSTFFLEYGWKIRPYNASHTLNVNGNMYARDGSDPYLDTVGVYTVRIIQSVSSLVDSTVQQLLEIERMAFGEGVTYDETNGVAGTNYPIGTPGRPVNNVTDAKAIAGNYGFVRGYIKGDLNVPLGEEINGFVFIGDTESRTTINIPESANFYDNIIKEATVEGYLDGDNTLDHCSVGNLYYIKGKMIHVTMNTGTITLGQTGHAQMEHCHSGVAGTGTPIIAFSAGSTMTLAIRDYHGGIKFADKNTTAACSVDMSSGQVKIASSVSAGTITLRGIGELTEDLSTGTAIIDDDMLNKYTIAKSVWDKTINGVISGTMGEVQRQLAFGEHIHLNVTDGEAGTAYPIGTHNHPVNNMADAITIAGIEGLDDIIVEEDVTVQATDDISGLTIKGTHANKSEITFVAGCTTSLCQIENAQIKGTLDGPVIIRDSLVDDINGFTGIMFQTMISGTINVASSANPSYLLNCYTSNDIPIEVDLSVAGSQCHVRDYTGGLKVVNKSGPESMTIALLAGKIILDATVTQGAFTVAGNALLIDGSSGTTIDETALLNSVVQLVQVDVTNILDIVTMVKKFDTNRTKIDENAFTLTVFDDNGTSPLQVYDLKDRNGVASFTEIFERVPQ